MRGFLFSERGCGVPGHKLDQLDERPSFALGSPLGGIPPCFFKVCASYLETITCRVLFFGSVQAADFNWVAAWSIGLEMKKAPFDRRLDENFNSLSIAQIERFVKGWPQDFDVQVAYSIRSAFIGWMPAARFAGMIAAKNEQIASATAAIVKAVGSQDDTP